MCKLLKKISRGIQTEKKTNHFGSNTRVYQKHATRLKPDCDRITGRNLHIHLQEILIKAKQEEKKTDSRVFVLGALEYTNIIIITNNCANNFNILEMKFKTNKKNTYLLNRK